MKTTIRIIALIFGLGAAALTVDFFLRTFVVPWDFDQLLHLVSYWPTRLYSAVVNPQPLASLTPLDYAFFIIAAGVPVLAVVLARLLDRSPLDWFVVSLIFPFTVAILALLGKGRTSANPYGGLLGHFFAVCTGKFCGRCHKAVPLSSQVGQRCPFCGAYWSYERTIQR